MENKEKKNIATAIRISGHSAPGVDQIPYRIWRKLDDLAVDVLYEAALEMQKPDAERILVEAHMDRTDVLGRHDFNLGILCCLPKKPAGTHENLGDFYSPSDTRPLSIVNTDNRLIASALRLAWEPIFNKWVSKVQRVFLKGRSMLANVIDIDEASMTVSLKEKYGGLVLFDFKAAFPSLSHDYLFSCLEHLGVPAFALNAIKLLYSQVRCVIKVKGTDHGEVDMKTGVRQGCPLSPLLFAVTVDLLLRRLTRLFPGTVFRAFADDIGAVFNDIIADADKIMEVFKQYGDASGLELNFPKTIVVPLWEGRETDARVESVKQNKRWENVDFRSAAVYLGFALGPGKGDSSWDKASRKFTQRVLLCVHRSRASTFRSTPTTPSLSLS